MYALDRHLIHFSEYQLAVYPSKIVFGVCDISADGSPSFTENSFVLLERQFVLFSGILITLLSKPSTYKLEFDFSNHIRSQQKVTIVIEDNHISFTIASGASTFVIVDKQEEIGVSARSLIKAFSNLVLKAYCYLPLVVNDLTLIVTQLSISDLERTIQETIFARFENIPSLSVNKYLLYELLTRHQKLLLNIKQICQLLSSHKKK